MQTQLNQLSLLVDTQQWFAAQALILPIQRQFAAVPPGRTGIYMQINIAQSLIKLATDGRADETGTLRGVYEQTSSGRSCKT